MLGKWSSHLNSTEIMHKFEAITCQWRGLQLTIFATKIISETCAITYSKGAFEVPKEFGHGATFARLLTAVLSLRRLVYLNYKKLNSLLQTKQSYSLEQLYFSEDDEDILFKSDSTAPDNVNDELDNNNNDNNIDEELKKRILENISEVALEPDVFTYDSWEDLVLEMTTIKRKSSLSTTSTPTSATATI